MPEEKNTKFCSNCGAEIDIKAKICPKCGVEQPLIPEKVSNWWYILAIFLGVIGGVIAWAINKDRNPKKAIYFLIAGLTLPIIYIIGTLFIVLVSLDTTKDKAKDTRIMVFMSQIQMSAEMVYDEENNYSMVGCAHPKIAFMCQDIKTHSKKEPIIHSTQKDYCAYVKLLSGDYYCIDSNCVSRKTSVYPGGIGYCNGKTLVCPK